MPASRSPTSSAGRRGRDETRKETGETQRGGTSARSPRDRPQTERKERADRSRSGSAAPLPPFAGMAEACRWENSQAGSRSGTSVAGEKRPAPEETTLQLGDWVCMKDRCYNHMYAKRNSCNRHREVGPGYSDDAVTVTADNRDWLTKCVVERKEEIARKRSKGKGRSRPDGAGSEAGWSSASWKADSWRGSEAGSGTS